jgi:hypothetical protein
METAEWLESIQEVVMRNNGVNTHKTNGLTYAVAASFALPLIAALAMPGAFLTAICFAVPFVGVAYLCGKNLSPAAESAT